MKYLLTIVLLMAPVFNEIAEINQHKKQAKEAYVNGDYESALAHYTYLVDSLGVNEPEVLLNLGNTYYKLQDTTAAISAYARVNNNGEAPIQSIAKQQNGILFNKSKKPEEALAYFKQALKDDPTNEDARYNYELLKKALEKQKEEEENQDEEQQDENQENQDQQDQEQQDQEQQNEDQENQENQDQEQESEDSDQKKEDKEGEESDEQDEDAEDSEESENSEEKKEQEEGEDGEQQDQEDKENKDEDLNNINEKLKDMKISEEKARMILEAMKNNEIQYFQQNKRKPTKKADPNKPDW